MANTKQVRVVAVAMGSMWVGAMGGTCEGMRWTRLALAGGT